MNRLLVGCSEDARLTLVATQTSETAPSHDWLLLLARRAGLFDEVVGKVKRLLVSSAALMWGLQLAFLNPALALILVTLFQATPAEVGWVLAVYNASGFLASLVLPSYADRKEDYLRPMLACGVLTLALNGLLALTTSLPIAVIGLIVLGGPAGVGSSLLFAHLKHSDTAASSSSVRSSLCCR
jgi:MFS family permease